MARHGMGFMGWLTLKWDAYQLKRFARRLAAAQRELDPVSAKVLPTATSCALGVCTVALITDLELRAAMIAIATDGWNRKTAVRVRSCGDDD